MGGSNFSRGDIDHTKRVINAKRYDFCIKVLNTLCTKSPTHSKKLRPICSNITCVVATACFVVGVGVGVGVVVVEILNKQLSKSNLIIGA